MTAILLIVVPLNYICTDLLMHEALKCLGHWQLIINDIMGKKRPRRQRTASQSIGSGLSTKSLKLDPNASVSASASMAGNSNILQDDAGSVISQGTANKYPLEDGPLDSASVANVSNSFTGSIITLTSDDIRAAESYPGRLMRAARYCMMQSELDYTLPAEETNEILSRAYKSEYSTFTRNQVLLRLNRTYGNNKLLWWLLVFPVYSIDRLHGYWLKCLLQYCSWMCVCYSRKNMLLVSSNTHALGEVIHQGILEAYQVNLTNKDGVDLGTKWKSRLLEKYIQDVRLVSERIKNTVIKLPDPIHRENYIMKSFLLSHMSTVFRRRLAERYFYTSLEEHEYEEGGASGGAYDPLYGGGSTVLRIKKNKAHYSNSGYPYLIPLICCVLLLAYALIALYIIFGYGVSTIGAKSTSIWFMTVIFAL